MGLLISTAEGLVMGGVCLQLDESVGLAKREKASSKELDFRVANRITVSRPTAVRKWREESL
jgi:hypothetical protein